MNTVRRHPYLTMLVLSTLGLGVFLFLTNPENVPVGILVIPIVLFFFIVFCVIQLFLRRVRLLSSKPRKQRTVALIGASLLTIIVILQSSGGLSGVDIVLLGLIVVVSVLYIDRF